MSTQAHDELPHVRASDFNHHIGREIDEVRQGAGRVVTHHGRPQMVVLSAREYEALLRDKATLERLRSHAVHGWAIREMEEGERG